MFVQIGHYYDNARTAKSIAMPNEVRPDYGFSCMDLATIATHRQAILTLAQKHGAEDVRIFGSVARGMSHESSDLDLLVSLGRKRTPFFPGGLKADLEELLGCEIDIVTEKALHRLIREDILREARPI